ncbi:MAG: hypothetical protein A2289_01420 [Deltaproteobacteria bacterium RIFOXYA12_FULL_58_15]|nr:MAG: hypothetical protein A2289_01420 [Deltaproteobacteria bacterium RIFOXYA12_FULL_58_15]OGR14047.1 MAG: hypothetical protein A2341_19075 [Deltaproteobacteria bacterium RIFOXYB12_FULL_58_9]
MRWVEISTVTMSLVLSAGSTWAESRQCYDHDGDGFGNGCAAGADCNDHNPNVNPGRKEVCDFVDNDCNALVDDAPQCPQPSHQLERLAVRGGPFIMGSDEGAADELPTHDVLVSSFHLDRFEVTNARYRACVLAGVCDPPALRSSRHRPQYFDADDFANYPAIFVSWHQANAFCHWAGGRLPTEAEWEMAARGPAPSTRTYPWGDEAPDCSRSNFGGDRGCVGDTDLVGRRPLGNSPHGAMDMAGNVWEWVADWYEAEYYTNSPLKNPQGPEQGNLKVMRGGCWESETSSLRVSCRKAELPKAWADNVGFRCAYDAPGGAR